MRLKGRRRCWSPSQDYSLFCKERLNARVVSRDRGETKDSNKKGVRERMRDLEKAGENKKQNQINSKDKLKESNIC